jgi:uncharacterized protein YjbI with pentapeptide repeats
VAGANFSQSSSGQLSAQQLYSTKSYADRNLAGIQFSSNNLQGWDLSGQNLTNSVLFGNISTTNLVGADLRGALTQPPVIADTANSRNLIRPDGSVLGVDVAGGTTFTVRDYDGKPTQTPPVGPIQVNVKNGFTMHGGGNLQLVIDADAWDSTISFQAGVPVTLSGFLTLAFSSNVRISDQIGRTIQVFNWTGVTPSGALSIVSPYQWDTSQLYSTGTIKLLSATSASGDMNGDGMVDAADYTVWRDNLGKAGAGLAADVSGWNGLPDGVVDHSDFDFWKANFGAGPGSSATNYRVPEPSSIILLLISLALSFLPRIAELRS